MGTPPAKDAPGALGAAFPAGVSNTTPRTAAASAPRSITLSKLKAVNARDKNFTVAKMKRGRVPEFRACWTGGNERPDSFQET